MLGYGIDTVFDAAALNERCGRVFREVSCTLGDAVAADCEIYVPYDTGALCRSVRRGDAACGEGTVGCDIVWSSPYASAVYYGDTRGVRYRTEHHAHARARWFEGAKASALGAWTQTVRDAVRALF